MSNRIIIASNRLPVTIRDKEGGLSASRSAGGLATALGPVCRQYNTIWVGWSGLRRSLVQSELDQLDLPKNLSLINLTEKQAYHYYDRVANSVLFPGFLNMEQLATCTAMDWKVFTDVSRRFAEAIKRASEPDDIIWLHDYHMVLVPQLLREAGVTNRIGFFLHAHNPFPSKDSLDDLPHSTHILKSLAQVNVLGFQTPHYANVFYAALRKLSSGLAPPEVVQSFPIGVDFGAYKNVGRSPVMQQLANKITQKTGGRKIILSVSRLDYVKGIIQQIRAVERTLLSMSPEERNQWVYKLVVAPSRETLEEYRRLKQEIHESVTQINERLGTPTWKPILYRYETLGFQELAAWYQAADIMLATPRVDGMNMVVKEYVAAHSDEGAVVLSQTTGAAFQMDQAVLVGNPLDIARVAEGLSRAITMPDAERSRRWHALRSIVIQEDIFWWTDRFLDTLMSASRRSEELDALRALVASGDQLRYTDLGRAAPLAG